MPPAAIDTTSQRCFVVHPSTPRATEVIEQCIKAACVGRYKYQVEASETNLAENILEGILNPLLTSPMVIAYLGSGEPSWNPNVMIEVGYRIASGLPLVLICDNGRDGKVHLPFDIDKKRVVVLPETLDPDAVSNAIASIQEQIGKQKAKLKPLSSVHPIAKIQVETSQIYRGLRMWKYVVASEQATQIFGIGGKLVGRTLQEFVRAQTKRMPHVQAYVFSKEQNSLVAAVSDAFPDPDHLPMERSSEPVAVARYPIVFAKHDDPKCVGRAYMPIITNNTLTEGILEVTVLYLDVTASVDRGHLADDEFKATRISELGENLNLYYFCKLDPGSPKIPDLPVPPAPESRVGIFLCYNSKYKEFVDEIYELLDLHGGYPWQDDKKIPGGGQIADLIDRALRECRAVWVFLGPEPGTFQLGVEINALLTLRTELNFDLLPILMPGLDKYPDWVSTLLRGIRYRTYEALKDDDWLNDYLRKLDLRPASGRIGRPTSSR